MTFKQAKKYYKTLSDADARRFNLLTQIALKLGKPIEGAYSYAKTIMESES